MGVCTKEGYEDAFERESFLFNYESLVNPVVYVFVGED